MPVVVTLAYASCYAGSLANPQDLYFVANAHWRELHRSEEGQFRWRVVSRGGQLVHTASGLRVLPDGELTELDEGSIVVVPAMNYPGGKRLTARLKSLAPEIEWLRQQYRRGCIICAHCTSSFILAETGLLDGKSATTSWWLADQFRLRYPAIELQADQFVLQQERCITGGATSAEALTALLMVERFMGPAIANQCAKTLLVDTNMTRQSPYLTLQTQQQHSDPLVSSAQAMLQSNLRSAFSLDMLASRLGVSPRTLIRRFKQALGDTPNSYLQNLRIETAKRLLETTGMPTDEVLQQVGYEDISSFSRLFQRKTGLTPRAYKQKFAIAELHSRTQQ